VIDAPAFLTHRVEETDLGLPGLVSVFRRSWIRDPMGTGNPRLAGSVIVGPGAQS
jgi:hypothetical protein